MIKNKKGITLVELVISIALITIVITFLFRLLIDVKYNMNDTDYDRNNQQTRAIIIKTIQKDFLERELIGLNDGGSSENMLKLIFSYKDGTGGTLEVGNDYISYTNSAGIEKWLLEKEQESTKFGMVAQYTNTYFLNDNSNFFYIQISIPVIVNSERENHIDDIELSYIGEKRNILSDDSFPNKGTLGKNN